MHIRNTLLSTAVLILAQTVAHADSAPKLPAYGAKADQTSVSGLSSGGFMTAQLHVAYSEQLIGAGIIAGGPYYCAGSYPTNTYLINATTTCMSPITNALAPNGEKLYKKAVEFAEKGWIDNVTNLKDDRVYIFTGSSDKTVKSVVVEEVPKFYKAAGMPEANIKFDGNKDAGENTVKSNLGEDAGHAIITNNARDTKCDVTEAPYINNCGFFQSHRILRHIYGELNAPDWKTDGKIIEFDQTEFTKPDNDSISMDKFGLAFIPTSCETKSCKIHIVFHGCEQGQEVIGADYYSITGYNEMAASNEMIILYPQAVPSKADPYNPKGCWDFWGYSSDNPLNPDFYKKSAPQMSAVMAMVKRLTEPKSE